jgi:hypothetical protein
MQTLFRCCAIVLAGLPAAASTLAAECDRLDQLSFRNSDVVRRDMQFETKIKDCFYVEAPAAWSVSAHYPYLSSVWGVETRTQLVLANWGAL